MTFINSVLERILELKSFEKKTVFSISTTAKQEESAYLTPVRICKDFILAGCIIFDQKDLFSLLGKIDGKVDIILSDSEKTIPFHANELNYELVKKPGQLGEATISSICFQTIKKSKVFEFKPNDLTVNATWSFLSQRFRFLSGKRISILGAGNIGSKLALKLVECGAEIHLYRRDAHKGNKIVHGLNLIKPESIIVNIQFHSDPMQASFMSDVLIGATSGYPIIDENIINNVKKNCLVVDLGKNNLTKNAIKIATQNSMEIYRSDVTPAIESYAYEVLKMQDILENSYGKKDLGFCNIVSGGFFGSLGDVVVDQINNPQRAIGIAQGNGSLKTTLNSKDQSNIDRLKREYYIEN
jgi:hypothetical protein